jgi:hypothetical protein
MRYLSTDFVVKGLLRDSKPHFLFSYGEAKQWWDGKQVYQAAASDTFWWCFRAISP